MTATWPATARRDALTSARPVGQHTDFDSFRVTWAVPLDRETRMWRLVAGWLAAHGVALGTEARLPCVASHPLLGEVLLYVGTQRDGRGRPVLAFGSTTEFAERVHVQPLGMPVPPVLRERGEARAKAEGLRLPVAALLSGRSA